MKHGKLEVRDGYDHMDWNKVEQLLSKAYWSEGIELPEIQKGAVNSALVVGAFLDDAQIGYLRVLSDKTRFAYIMDVYVQPEHRGKGAGKAMMAHVMAHPELADVYHWTLVTQDAHSLYEKYGFVRTWRPEGWMEIRRPPERKKPARE